MQFEQLGQPGFAIGAWAAGDGAIGCSKRRNRGWAPEARHVPEIVKKATVGQPKLRVKSAAAVVLD